MAGIKEPDILVIDADKLDGMDVDVPDDTLGWEPIAVGVVGAWTSEGSRTVYLCAIVC